MGADFTCLHCDDRVSREANDRAMQIFAHKADVTQEAEVEDGSRVASLVTLQMSEEWLSSLTPLQNGRS